MRTSTVCLIALLTLTGCPDSDSAGGQNVDRPDLGPDIDAGGDGGDDVGPCVPADETCNGADDDCDGTVDNGFDLQGDPENCGGCGEICDLANAVPHCTAGACVVTECEQGWFDVDGVAANGCESEACEATGDEICDGIDNDCDGAVDEEFDVGANPVHCAMCGDVCEVAGATASCESGVCGVGTCDEGRVDTNGVPGDGCECATTNNAVEVCDGVDNDCDGVVDDGIDLNVVERCGACDVQCAYENGVPSCEDMQCVMAGCEEGFFDLNGRETDGCEYACAPEDPSDTDIACDGQDNDCDGEADNDTNEGGDCELAEGLGGILVCSEQGLLCTALPSEGPVDICGPISGVLTARGGPYRIVCPEVVVEADTTLVVEAGAVVETGLLDDEPARARVSGRLASTGGMWRGVSISLDDGAVSLAGDMMVATGGETLLDASGPGELSTQGVTLRGPGNGLDVAGASGRYSIAGGAFIGLGVGIVVATTEPLAVTGVTFENNGVALRVDAAVPGVGVILEGGALRSTIGPGQIGIEVVGDDADTVVSLGDTRVAQRDIDQVVRMDPDQLRGLAGTVTILSDVPNRIHLHGELDRADATLMVLGDLREYSALGGLNIAANRTLTGAADTVMFGAGATLGIDGSLVAAGSVLHNLYLRPAVGGTLDLSASRVEVTAENLEGCLLSAPDEATVILTDTVLAQEPLGVSPDLDAVCLPSATGARAWDGGVLRGFRTGLLLVDAGEFDIAGLTFDDDTIGIDWQGQTLGTIADNTFMSGRARQVLAVRLRTAAAPGGAVRDNTIEFDTGDFVLDIDPDCLTEAGTAFGPNTWNGSRPGSYLLGGIQDGGDLIIRDLTERPEQDAFFLTVQIREDVVITQDASFEVAPGGRQIVTLQGLGTATLAVEGTLRWQGPGVFVSQLPVSFLPGSEGSVSAVAISSSRSDSALVTIDDAEPTIGGNSRFDEVQITGSNLRDSVGIEIHSMDPMCQVQENLCPFVANNTFRNLAIGILAHRPASFSGVNDFDDADGDDSVPVNVELR